MRQFLSGKRLNEVAIGLIQMHSETACEMHQDGYYVANSGGKDSTVIVDLVKRSGCAASYHHNVTTVDPPQVIRYLKHHHPETTLHLPKENMWQLIARKKMPPRRQARYCCEILKERGGNGRIVVTGVRWVESNRRSKRRQVERCMRNANKLYLNPIIAWTDADVWQYIRERGLPYCELYDPPFNQKRVGCILCPMARDVQRQMALWPKICERWERAVKATFKPHRKDLVFKTPQEYWEWWLDRDAPGKADPSQLVLFEDDPELVAFTPEESNDE